MLAVALAVAVCSLGLGCGGGDGGGAPGDGGTAGNDRGNGAPQAGDKPIGAGHKGQPGKRARGGPIDVPKINLKDMPAEQVADYLDERIIPQCPGGRKRCVHYVFTDTKGCYELGALSYPHPLLPGGTITIPMGTCDRPDITDEPSDPGSPPPTEPSIPPEPSIQPEPSSAPS